VSTAARGPGRPGALARALAQRFALRRVNERFAIGLGAAAAEHGQRLAAAGVIPDTDAVFGLTLAEATGAVAPPHTGGAPPTPPTGPDLGALAGKESLVLTATNVAMPLTVLLGAIDAVVAHADTPFADAAVAASFVGVPFITRLAAPAALRDQNVTLSDNSTPDESGMANISTSGC
jgi:hypothetical protein